MSKTKGSVEDDDQEYDNNDEISIKEGANDLMNLPIETLREELKKRNFHPGVVDRMEKWFLASMLRKSSMSSCIYSYSLTKREHGGNTEGPIFSHEEVSHKKDEKEYQRMETLPSSFRKYVPYIRSAKKICLTNNKPENHNPWANKENYSLSNYVPIDVLESLPPETKQKVQDEIQNRTDFDEIIAKYLIPDIHP